MSYHGVHVLMHGILRNALSMAKGKKLYCITQRGLSTGLMLLCRLTLFHQLLNIGSKYLCNIIDLWKCVPMHMPKSHLIILFMTCRRGVLNKSVGIEDIGTIQWDLFLCLLVSWIILYFCVWRGLGWTSKVTFYNILLL